MNHSPFQRRLAQLLPATVFALEMLQSAYSQGPKAHPKAPEIPGPTPDHVFEKPRAVEADRPAGRLGLNVEEVADDGVGLRVAVVVKDSPAKKAAIEVGDVLLKFDDQLLIAPKQLEVLIKQSTVGTQALLSLLRNGEPLELPVTLDAAEEPPPSPQLAAKDFEVTRRVLRLTVGEGQEQTTIALSTREQKAHLIIKEADNVEFDGLVSAESEIPPHLRGSIRKVASLNEGKWVFHLPLLPPVE